jgi:hypothetical protein
MSMREFLEQPLLDRDLSIENDGSSRKTSAVFFLETDSGSVRVLFYPTMPTLVW